MLEALADYYDIAYDQTGSHVTFSVSRWATYHGSGAQADEACLHPEVPGFDCGGQPWRRQLKITRSLFADSVKPKAEAFSLSFQTCLYGRR
jgi:hypothetical protein